MQRGIRRSTAMVTVALAAMALTGTGAAFGVLGLDPLASGEISGEVSGEAAAGKRWSGEGSAQGRAGDETPGAHASGPDASWGDLGGAAGPVTPVRDVEPPRVFDPVPEPEALLERGDRGVEVRELQHRLLQLVWLSVPPTGTYDPGTVRAVRGFQDKRGFDVTGEVDRRTWRRLVAMSRTPSSDEMFNRAGPALYAAGSSGPEVRGIQARLRQIAWFSGDVSDHYGDRTVAAVRGFQAKRMVPVTGEVDRRTLDLLVAMTAEPTAAELANRPPEPVKASGKGSGLDPRCLSGRALCVDKSSNSLRWVVDGKVVTTVDVRFGSDELPTREGQFAVTYKSRDHVSSLYDTSMPFAMFFSGGQAVHYSPDFAANGYSGASHGCVNVRDYDTIAWLYDEVNVGDKVVVYWS